MEAEEEEWREVGVEERKALEEEEEVYGEEEECAEVAVAVVDDECTNGVLPDCRAV